MDTGLFVAWLFSGELRKVGVLICYINANLWKTKGLVKEAIIQIHDPNLS